MKVKRYEGITRGKEIRKCKYCGIPHLGILCQEASEKLTKEGNG